MELLLQLLSDDGTVQQVFGGKAQDVTDGTKKNVSPHSVSDKHLLMDTNLFIQFL